MPGKTALLTTKFFVSASDRHIIRRPRLEERLKHIHSKLDVSNRTEAVARGRELGLVL